jgi:hypothetical protein
MRSGLASASIPGGDACVFLFDVGNSVSPFP